MSDVGSVCFFCVGPTGLPRFGSVPPVPPARYTFPPAFKDDELASIHETTQREIGNLVTCTANRLIYTQLPILLHERGGEQGIIYGHAAMPTHNGKKRRCMRRSGDL
jgi:hypothetical protein